MGLGLGLGALAWVRAWVGLDLCGKEDVLRLEVAVDDVERVQLREREDGAARVELHRLRRLVRVRVRVRVRHKPEPEPEPEPEP